MLKRGMPAQAPYEALDALWFGRPGSSPAGFPPTPTPPPTRLPHIAHLDLKRRSRLNTSHSSALPFQLSAPSTPITTAHSGPLHLSPSHLGISWPASPKQPRCSSLPPSSPVAVVPCSPSTPASCPPLGLVEDDFAHAQVVGLLLHHILAS